MSGPLQVEIVIYAGGVLRTAPGLRFLLETGEGRWEQFRVPCLLHADQQYRLELECRGSAGPEGWLAFRGSLFDHTNTMLGPLGLPMLLWTRPWTVPMVSHFPPAAPGWPVHTVTMRVCRDVVTLDPQDTS